MVVRLARIARVLQAGGGSHARREGSVEPPPERLAPGRIEEERPDRRAVPIEVRPGLRLDREHLNVVLSKRVGDPECVARPGTSEAGRDRCREYIGEDRTDRLCRPGIAAVPQDEPWRP